MFHLNLHINFSRNVSELVKRIEISILGLDSLFLSVGDMVHICMQWHLVPMPSLFSSLTYGGDMDKRLRLTSFWVKAALI